MDFTEKLKLPGISFPIDESHVQHLLQQQQQDFPH